MGGGSDLQRLSGGENCVLGPRRGVPSAPTKLMCPATTRLDGVARRTDSHAATPSSRRRVDGVHDSVIAGSAEIDKQHKNAGMVTGVLSKCCNYPCLVWKNTLQQGIKLNTTWTTSSGAFSPLKVYIGLPMACMNLGGTNAVQFVGTGFFQKLLAKSSSDKDAVQVGGAFLGGAASGVPCSIWELCMIQQQRFGGSTLGTPRASLVNMARRRSGAASPRPSGGRPCSP